MTSPQTSEPESSVIRHLQALRREVASIAETQELVLKKLNRQEERLARVESDIASLELKDFGRHGELLTILRKLAHIDEDAT